jgi:hypothetical protein
MTERERFLKLCEDFDTLETKREEALGREDNRTAARLLRQSDTVYKKIQTMRGL